MKSIFNIKSITAQDMKEWHDISAKIYEAAKREYIRRLALIIAKTIEGAKKHEG